MLLTRPSSTSRRAIDDAIAEALARIESRARRSGGDRTGRLAAALARAAAGGKRFRPALVAGAHEAFGGHADEAMHVVAAAFELLHTAFVVHDDVIDGDTERRGTPNVSGEFAELARAEGADEREAAVLGDAAGILAGDLLLHESLRLLALMDVPGDVRVRLLDLVDEAVYVSVAGELADVAHAVLPGAATPASILAATRDKTAVYSFAAPLQAGAVLAGASAADVAALGRAGRELGLAFQLVDDLIGAFGTPEAAGRASGADLREQKQTPLIALARESEDWPRAAAALAQARTGPVAVRTAQQALAETGARDRLRALIDDALDAAARAPRTAEMPAAAIALVDEVAAAVRSRVP